MFITLSTKVEIDSPLKEHSVGPLSFSSEPILKNHISQIVLFEISWSVDDVCLTHCHQEGVSCLLNEQ